MSNSIEEYRWLVSSPASGFLAETLEQIENKVNVVRIAKQLRKDMTPSRSAMVLELAQQRIRGRKKFALADQMFFTKRGLQQASSQPIAEYKAQRFAKCNRVADVCCSIGGDLLSLAKVAKTTGVDNDPVTTLFAQRNLEVHNLLNASTAECNFEDFDLADFDAVHIDPDRRAKGSTAGRTTHGDFFSPSLPSIFQRLNESKFESKFAAIKVAPATLASVCLPDQYEIEWIGDRRECKQQLIWTGVAVENPGTMTATRVDGGQVHHFITNAKLLNEPAPVASEVALYLFEPHSSILAGQMTDAFANSCELKRLASDIVYLTSDSPVQHSMMRRFCVEAVLPIDARKVHEYFRERQVGLLEIKNRGVPKFVVEKFERLKLSGDEKRVLFLTRHRRTQVAIVATREE